MEFSDTYATAKLVQEQCENDGIRFIVAKADSKPVDNWMEFGPPATTTRWCCSVHKTAPQIIALREILNISDFCGMAIVGVRAEESLARSKYEYVSLGEKHKGQYSCNVILDWNSAEIYLYSYMENLVFNETYKKGNRRAGCLICPRAADRNDFMNHYWYKEEAEKLVDAIRWTYRDAFPSSERLEQFIMNGGWKARKNGRDLSIPLGYSEERAKDGTLTIAINEPKTDWLVWIKTIGIIETQVEGGYVINFRGNEPIRIASLFDSYLPSLHRRQRGTT